MPQTPANGAVGLNNKQLLLLFPSPMFMGMLPDMSLCDRLERKLTTMRAAGEGRTAPKNASPAFVTSDNLHLMPEMKDLVDIIMSESGKILDAYAMKRDSHYIVGMWANITHPNNRQNMHVHPNCFLSGLVYIKAPLSCGPTMFCSPRKFTKNIEAQYTEKNELNTDFMMVPAEKGRMLFWPSHLPHAVESGTADETQERIVIAFNIMIKGKVDLFTSRVEFA